MKKYALITGGSRGIGRAVCVALAKKGYHVLINYVSNSQAAEETLQEVRSVGGDGELMSFDVTDREGVQTVLNEWQQLHPKEYIEVLVNNAGIRMDSSLMMMEPEAWNRVLDTSLGGFYNVTQPLLLQMQAHRYGRIVSMASVSGVKGQPGQTNYAAAKGAIVSATKSLALEVAKRGVTVNAIAPGFIRTDMVEGLDESALCKTIPSGRFGLPEEVAAAVVFLASPEAAYITGHVLNINGGLYT